MESVSQVSGSLSRAPVIASRRAGARADRTTASEHKSSALILVSLLALLNSWGISILEPGFADRPSALISHMLVLLGAAVTFLGLWDILALLALRHLLQRDRQTLWRHYGHPKSLQRRLDNSTFELDAALGGGLLTTTLRRFNVFGGSNNDFVERHLAEAIRSSRIGTASLAYIAVTAPILGILGAAAGLQAFLSTGSPKTHLEAALGVFILGLSISLLALFFTRLLGTSLAEDCASLLAPVFEAGRDLTGRGKSRGNPESDAAAAKRLLVWAGSPWSDELRRLRALSAAASWLVTAVLLVLMRLPGGLTALMQP